MSTFWAMHSLNQTTLFQCSYFTKEKNIPSLNVGNSLSVTVGSSDLWKHVVLSALVFVTSCFLPGSCLSPAPVHCCVVICLSKSHLASLFLPVIV